MNPTFRVSPSTRRNFLKHLSALAVSGGVFLHELNAQDTKFVVAETAFGKIRGVDNNGIKIFKGIPYGASTAGANRFMPPAEPADWSGVRDALAYGHSAPQRDPDAPPTPGALTHLRPKLAGRGRRLPGAQYLDARRGPCRRERPQAPRDVLVPWRRIRHRFRIVSR